MHNTHTSLQNIKEIFCGLPKPQSTIEAGDYRAEMTGPIWIRTTAPSALACIGFYGWCGKRFTATGQACNLKTRGEELLEFQPMSLAIEISRADLAPCWVLRYPPSTHFPVRRMVDELRSLTDNVILGMSYTEIPGLRNLGLPFLLRRQN